jgi:TATA-binding protein-associated factor Taf7
LAASLSARDHELILADQRRKHEAEVAALKAAASESEPSENDDDEESESESDADPYEGKTKAQLLELAAAAGLEGLDKLNKPAIVEALKAAASESE